MWLCLQTLSALGEANWISLPPPHGCYKFLEWKTNPSWRTGVALCALAPGARLPGWLVGWLATLTSMSFFKRSGTYNLDCFGRVGYKNDVKTAKKKKKIYIYIYITHVHMYLIVELITSIRIRFLLPIYSLWYFCTLTSKNDIFICLGEISFLGYKVGKLIFFSPVCVWMLYSINSSSCSTAICIISLVTLFLKTKSNR